MLKPFYVTVQRVAVFSHTFTVPASSSEDAADAVWDIEEGYEWTPWDMENANEDITEIEAGEAEGSEI